LAHFSIFKPLNGAKDDRVATSNFLWVSFSWDKLFL